VSCGPQSPEHPRPIEPLPFTMFAETHGIHYPGLIRVTRRALRA
jgi:hypothetical protein